MQTWKKSQDQILPTIIFLLPRQNGILAMDILQELKFNTWGVILEVIIFQTKGKEMAHPSSLI